MGCIIYFIGTHHLTSCFVHMRIISWTLCVVRSRLLFLSCQRVHEKIRCNKKIQIGHHALQCERWLVFFPKSVMTARQHCLAKPSFNKTLMVWFNIPSLHSHHSLSHSNLVVEKWQAASNTEATVNKCIIKSPALRWHSCTWCLYVNSWPQLSVHFIYQASWQWVMLFWLMACTRGSSFGCDDSPRWQQVRAHCFALQRERVSELQIIHLSLPACVSLFFFFLYLYHRKCCLWACE